MGFGLMSRVWWEEQHSTRLKGGVGKKGVQYNRLRNNRDPF